MADTDSLYLRWNGKNNNLYTVNKGERREKGAHVACRTRTLAANVLVYKMRHRNAADAIKNGTGLFVRWQGIDYALCTPQTGSKNYFIVCDDCPDKNGNVVTYDFGSSVATATDDGYYFTSLNCLINIYNPFEFFTSSSPLTIAFKVKGTSATGSEGVGTIAIFSTDPDRFVVGRYTDGRFFDAWYFGIRSNGELVFKDFFQETVFTGSKTDWRDFKITFTPNGTVYNSTLDANVLQINFSATCNGVSKSGTTYFYGSKSFYFKIGFQNAGTSAIVHGGSEKGRCLEGYIKYLSISQDTEGYAPYRRSTHKVLLHFD